MVRPTRRRFLSAVAAGAASGLAGCAVKTCNGDRTTPTAVHGPATDPVPADPPGPADWPMHGGGPRNTWSLPDDALAATGLAHRFTVSLPVESGATATPTPTDGTGTDGTTTPETATDDTATGVRTADADRPKRRLWPVAVGDRLYVADEGGAVRALRAADGSEVWVADVVAPTRPPAVGEQAVYAADDTAVVALDRADGAVLWRYDLGTRFGTPVLAGGAVFVTGRERVHAVETDDGSRRWLAPTGDSPGRPAVADSAVYVASDRGGTVTARGPADGAKLWQQAGDFGYLGNVEFAEYTGTRPPTVRDGTVYVPQGHAVVALDAGDGGVGWTWESNGNDYLGTLAVTDDQVFVEAFYRPSGAGKLDTMFALSAEGGETQWCRPVGGATLRTSPVAGDEHALAQFRAVEGAADRLVLFDADGGATPWVFRGYDGRALSPVVAGGSLYVGTDAGHLYGLTLT